MNKFFEILFSRAIILITAFLAQILFIILIVAKFQGNFFNFYLFSVMLSFFLVLFLVGSNMNPSYKIAWIIPIMLFPSFGWIIYLLFSGSRFNKVTKKKERKYYTKHLQELSKSILKDEKILNKVKKDDPIAMRQMRYLVDYGESQVFDNYESQYFSSGESYFEGLLSEIKNAKKFIFMEYFIIGEGYMWGEILEQLKIKAKQGVEVRIIYDDLGCITSLPKDYDKELEQYNIKCSIFNPASLLFTVIYNNRTHRKITVIDGEVAFTGGINLADEYINKIQKFGHWKDTGILIKGEGTWGFTVMFLNTWKLIRKIDEDFLKYKCNETDKFNKKDGYVIPFSDSPLDKEIVSSNVYLALINNAVEYVYINTPYLIIDHEMTQALCQSAKRGVDVRIVTPHIADKKAVFEVTRSNFQVLMESGIKIYAYTPGFIHAKSFVVDDKYAVVGTINLDFRSLFLHFECGLWIYKSKTILDIKKDYIETIKECHKYTSKEYKNISKTRVIYRAILKMFAPIL